jgi:hypothetical protein
MSGCGLSFGLASRATPGWFSQSLERRRDSGGRRQKKSSVTMEPLERRTVPSSITVQNLDDSGAGSLRAAIEQANLDMAQDTITFAPALAGTITLSSALPDLSTNMIIAGPGPSTLTVASNFPPPSSGAVSGVVTVSAGASVSISGLTITGGNNTSTGGGGIENAGTLTLVNLRISGNSSGQGGGIYTNGMLTVEDTTLTGNSAASGGGISNAGTLTLENSTVSDNTAVSAGLGNGIGGGIDNTGTLTLLNTVISDNDNAGGPLGNANGGGIYSTGTLSVQNATISGNSAILGAGIYNAGTASVVNTTISGNSGAGSRLAFGGGIYNAGKLTLEDSTVSGNSTVSDFKLGSGGGIYNTGTVTLINDTVSGNDANTSGDGILNTGNIFLTYSTISGNFISGTDSGDGIENLSTQNRAVVAIDTIFDSDGGASVSGGGGGAFQSLGHNLFSDNPDFTVLSTDLINTNPMLGPLAANGGPTLTEALLPGSPAVNAGVPVAGVTTDQRGIYRPQGAAPDIGAFELQLPPVVVSVHRHGVHLQPTTLVITFSQPMDAARAKSIADYRLVSAGPDHRFGTGDDRVIRIRSARYSAATLQVTLRPIRRLPLHGTFQLTIVGTPLTGLLDSEDLFLDGAGTGQAGSNYVTVIGAK